VEKYRRATSDLIKRDYYEAAVSLWSRYPDALIPEENFQLDENIREVFTFHCLI